MDMFIRSGASNSGSAALNTVYYAPLNANGTVGASGLNNRIAGSNEVPCVLSSRTAMYMSLVVRILATQPSRQFTLRSMPRESAPDCNDCNAGANGYANAVIANGYVYVIGSGIVYYAPLNADGTVGAWTTGAQCRWRCISIQLLQ